VHTVVFAVRAAPSGAFGHRRRTQVRTTVPQTNTNSPSTTARTTRPGNDCCRVDRPGAAYTRAHAQTLCNATELELIVAAMRDAIGALTPAQVRVRIRRARALRDRQATLLAGQAGATRAAAGTGRGTPDANRRTGRKLELFEEALRRFEARLSALDAGAPGNAPSRTGRGGTPSKKAAPRRTPATPARPKKSVARKAAATGAAKAARRAAVPGAAAAAPAKARKPAAPARSPKAPAVAAPSRKARAPKTGNPVSPAVRLRGKVIGSHVRTATARNQARRDGR